MGSIWPVGERTVKRAAHLLTLLLLALLGWQLAGLYWQLADPSAEVIERSPLPLQPKVGQRPPSETLADVAALSLFGRASTETEAVVEVPLEAPETRLRLTLKGVVGGRVDRPGGAIIADERQVERYYALGEAVPGGATLEQVHPDRVILSRAGRFETLRLPREPVLSAVSPVSPQQQPRAEGDGAGALDTLRQALVDNPQHLFEVLEIRPVMEGGEMRGYHIRPLQHQEIFRRAGLRPDDTVVAINGIPVTNPDSLMGVFAGLSSATELTLTIERRGRRSDLSLNF